MYAANLKASQVGKAQDVFKIIRHVLCHTETDEDLTEDHPRRTAIDPSDIGGGEEKLGFSVN